MEQELKKRKKKASIVKKSILTDNKKNKKKKRNVSIEDEEEETEEDYCVVCLSSYSESRPKEVWIQCSQCKLWAHEACTPGFPIYLCHNCDSDDSD